MQGKRLALVIMPVTPVLFLKTRPFNRLLLLIAIGGSLLLWIIFGMLYPYPDVVPDSCHYVQAAADINMAGMLPVGYSIFIRLAVFFSHSALWLVSLQFGCMVFSFLLFFITVQAIFKLPDLCLVLLLLFLFANPIFYYTCNLIMADALFIALSVLWLTHLLWIIYAPRPWMVITHALLLCLSFTVRYNALYYPLAGCLAYILSRQPLWLKGSGIILQLILPGAFIIYTSLQVQAVSGQKQFAALSGWKIANNALYMYEHTYKYPQPAVPARFARLDRMVRQYFTSPFNRAQMLTSGDTNGNYYIYVHASPLKQYMAAVYSPGSPLSDLSKFTSLGLLYQEYGIYLVKQHPGAFLHYFVAPNIWRYYSPPLEVYDRPSRLYLHDDRPAPAVLKWFGSVVPDKPDRFMWLRLQLLAPYPTLMSVLHFTFAMSIICFIFSGNRKKIPRTINSILLTVAVLFLSDLVFNLFTAAIVMRYLLFAMIIEFTFSLVLLVAAFPGDTMPAAR